jgi:hypothetical protein
MRLIASLVAVFAFWSSPALAQQCTPEFVERSQTVTVGAIKVGVGESSRENFNIRVRNQGSGPCSATIRVARIDGSAVSANLEYRLRSGSSVLQILPNETAASTSQSELFVASLPAGQNGRSVPFQLTFPTDWGIEAGFHSEQLQLTILDKSGLVTDTLLLAINVNVPPSVSIRIVGATGSNRIASINLGDIKPNMISRSDPFGVRIWSTSAYSVSFTSENQGVLRHEGGQDSIPYEMRMDDQLVDLVAGGDFAFPDRTSSLGLVHRLRVQAGPAKGRAGEYSDRVTVTVTAV